MPVVLFRTHLTSVHGIALVALLPFGAASLIGCRQGDSVATTPQPTSDVPLTFNRDIAPIIDARCAACHRPGEAGPFNLLTS